MKNKTMKYVSRAVAFLLGMLLLLSLVPMSVMASEVEEELPVNPYAGEPESDPIPEGGLLPEGWIPLEETPNEGNDWIQGIPDGSISMGDHASLGGGEQASIQSVENAGPVDNGVYWIKDLASNLYLTVADCGFTSGTAVQLASSITGDELRSQLFKITYAGTDGSYHYYTVRSMTNNSIVLTIPSVGGAVTVTTMDETPFANDNYEQLIVFSNGETNTQIQGGWEAIKHSIMAPSNVTSGTAVSADSYMDVVRNFTLVEYTGGTIDGIEWVNFKDALGLNEEYTYKTVMYSTNLDYNGPVYYSTMEGLDTGELIINADTGVAVASSSGHVILSASFDGSTSNWERTITIGTTTKAPDVGSGVYRIKLVADENNDYYLHVPYNSSSGNLQAPQLHALDESNPGYLYQLFKITYLETAEGLDYYTIRYMSDNSYGLVLESGYVSNTLLGTTDISLGETGISIVATEDGYLIQGGLLISRGSLAVTSSPYYGATVASVETLTGAHAEWSLERYEKPINSMIWRRFLSTIYDDQSFTYQAVMGSSQIYVNGPVTYDVVTVGGTGVLAHINATTGKLTPLTYGRVRVLASFSGAGGSWYTEVVILHRNAFPEGVYKIKNVASGLCLDVTDGATTAGSGLQMWSSEGANDGNRNQMFKIAYLRHQSGVDYYNVRSMTNNAVSLSITSEGVSLQILPTQDTFEELSSSQQIAIEKVNGGYYIKSQAQSTPWLAASTSNMNVWEVSVAYNAAGNVTWMFEEYTGSAVKGITPTRFVNNVKKGTTYDYDFVVYSTTIGQNGPASYSVPSITGYNPASINSLGILTANEVGHVSLKVTFDGAPQIWSWDVYVRLPNGQYFIKQNASKLFLTAKDNSKLQQYVYSSVLNQQWSVQYASEGYYRIKYESDGKTYYATSPNSTANGAVNLVEQALSGTDADRQLWEFISLSNGTYQIRAKNQSYVMSSTSSADDNGANVVQKGSTSGPITEWKLAESKYFWKTDGIFPNDNTINLQIKGTVANSAEWLSLIGAAVDSWNNCGAGVTILVTPDDSIHTITVDIETPPSKTLAQYFSRTGDIVVYALGLEGYSDTVKQGAIAHEIGHMLKLTHVPASNDIPSVMFPSVDNGDYGFYHLPQPVDVSNVYFWFN